MLKLVQASRPTCCVKVASDDALVPAVDAAALAPCAGAAIVELGTNEGAGGRMRDSVGRLRLSPPELLVAVIGAAETRRLTTGDGLLSSSVSSSVSVSRSW